MKKTVCILLVLCLVLSFAACAAPETAVTTAPAETAAPTETAAPAETVAPAITAAPTETSVPETTQALLPEDTLAEPVAVPEGNVTYLAMHVGNAEGIVGSLSATDNGDGTVYVEYVGTEKKVGTFGAEVFDTITDAFVRSGLTALNGQDVYNDGSQFCSMFVQFGEETYVAASYSGTIDPAFLAGYDVMDACFAELTASLPVYIPKAMVMGTVDEDALAAMEEIVNNSGMDYLDGLAISDIPLDQYFALSAGLSGHEGLTNGTVCSAMMTVTPYSLVIVTLEDVQGISSVRDDFAFNLGWRNWVCVAPEEALIAQKDNMVLCLLASDPMFTQTADAIENAGWTEMEFFRNPDLE